MVLRTKLDQILSHYCFEFASSFNVSQCNGTQCIMYLNAVFELRLE